MNILILGASGHAKVIMDIIEKAGIHQIAGLTSDDSQHTGVLCGYSILGQIHDLPRIFEDCRVEGLVAAVGDNWNRGEVVRCVHDILPRGKFVTGIHPSAQIARSAEVGGGTVIMAGAVVNSGSRICNHCIINTRASVDHDSVIGEFVSLAPGVTLGGNVRIGAFSTICLGANVIHGITIGEHTVIGAGSTVLTDLPSYVIAYGTPARVIRQRHKGQRYL